MEVQGVSGHLDQMTQRTMQGKSSLYATLGKRTSLATLFGYETAACRKARGLPKTHIIDVLSFSQHSIRKLKKVVNGWDGLRLDLPTQ